MPKFVPRDRKQRRLPKQRHNGTDTNTEELVAETQSERDVRRAKLAADLREQQPQSKMSSKKRKRLDKYVDSKLKKEENLELLKKLAAHKVDTSLLQSSKKLGRVSETKRERFSRALQEQAAGIGEHNDVLFDQRPNEHSEAESEALDLSAEEDGEAVTEAAPEVAKPVTNFGGGLKRPLDVGEDGQPVIKKRKRRKTRKHEAPTPAQSDDDDDDDDDDSAEEADGLSDFSSSDAAEEGEWQGFSEEEDQRSRDEEKASAFSSDSEVIEDPDELSSVASDDEDDDIDSGSATSVVSDRKERVSAFKQWADTQRNTAMDFTPSAAPTTSTEADLAVRANFKPRQASPDPMLAASNILAGGQRTSRPAAAISVPRAEEIQEARLQLPVVQEEQKIMEAIHSNPIVIVCGATGSGKTTQVPQMMFESGYGSHIGDRTASDTAGPQSKGMIGVTQPRRVAAVSVAERVAVELGPSYRSRVAHQVRYDTNVGRETAVKFMTDGILLREVSQDFILSRYSSIVIDEAHERSVNTDILIGMLSRIVRLRSELAREDPKKYYPLKLVIMSATLRVSDFAENPRLFREGAPPIVQAEGRQYPVEVHWSRRTQRDFVAEAVSKVARGHRKLPPGGMLVFLTSQNEIQVVAKRLKEKLGGNAATYTFGKARNEREQRPLEEDDFEDEGGKRSNDYLEGEEDEDSEPDIIGLDPEADDAEFDIAEEATHFGSQDRGALKPHVLPLYAALPSAQQLKVFQPPPPGHRLIVLATNVAETSLTIPGVRYVFDSGRAKEKRYDLSTGVQTFEIDWISKASASQRAGRAGRTGPGHVYKLYSSAVYEQFFAEHTAPEILRTPLESTVLQLKVMDIDNVINFPFPTSPDATQLSQAERLLRNLGAIAEVDGIITEKGKEMMGYPVSPRFAKMLILGKMNDVLDFAIAVVAGLAVGDLFIQEAQAAGADGDDGAAEPSEDDDSDAETRREKRQMQSAAQTAAQKRHQSFTTAQVKLARRDDRSDAVKLLTAVAVHAEKSGKDQAMSAASTFCEEFFLREKGMSEVQQLRRQLQNIVSARQAASNNATTFKDILAKPTDKELAKLNQIVAAGFLDQIAIRADLLPSSSETTSAFGRKPRRAIEVPYRPLIPSADIDKALSPQDQEMRRSVFIHPSSVLAKLTVSEMPKYIVYTHLSRAAAPTVTTTKVARTRMHPLTAIEDGKVLANLAEGTPLLEYGKPLGKIEELGGGRRQCLVSVSLRAPVGSGEWPLTAWKVVQKRGRRDWVVEKVIAR
ncbi:hypothetical protein B0A50_07801 [Salinomyces thailandicus]|uniref:RNA helicase n=1 Tax=Salinomyces thailandicus TaxID=706561 RepID=A0A4U0TL96_9PEZI|nr:hypothetical protein B0A50_07801 [Salinomyces thailandica]